MAKWLVRAKYKIKPARIPDRIPDEPKWSDRLHVVLRSPVVPTPAPTFRPEDDQPAGPSKSSSHATVALVVALIGVVLFGVILGPIAIVLAVRARNEIDESNGQLRGRGRATVAIFVGVGAFVAGLVTLIAAFSA